MLDYGTGTFSSSIAVCNAPAERDRLIGEIGAARPGIVTISIPSRTVDIFGYVTGHVDDVPPTLFVVGLESSVSSPEVDSHTLRSLNASRDLWPKRFPCPVVLWLPEYAATALSQQARDYWRFLSHHFYFAAESKETVPQSRDDYQGKYVNAISLSHDEKLARISELESRLSSIGDPPDSIVQQHALTWWDEIATLKAFMGNSTEALRIRREEELPVYEQLGDVREKAIAMGKIADILHARGQLDDALRIRQEEQLPVFERLGDTRTKAMTLGQIADILHERGQLSDALRIRQTEELPAFERLGDVREKAVTLGKIADIFYDRGQLGDALRIRQEEQLPVYERLGDMRGLIITRAKIGMTLSQRPSASREQLLEAREHLMWALTEAEKRQYTETARLRQIVAKLLDSHALPGSS
ncbi:hypothetical protein [Fimbriiglobus ruber]|uniref:hypothetical protein n=1 Tax=Fimbriiglobus ruber TaxID=1908690 RepID=UPI00117B6B5A|nr:hypothetical protein [Fimbriiglobus ruber]